MCLLAQTKIAQNKQNNDDDTDKINDLVHGIPNLGSNRAIAPHTGKATPSWCRTNQFGLVAKLHRSPYPTQHPHRIDQ
ncbi:MAG TPA: hypothetical protein DHR80_20175 [Thalassospira lucentensis]|nr:hypothetical protein [Thalassospira lucentensis]